MRDVKKQGSANKNGRKTDLSNAKNQVIVEEEEEDGHHGREGS